MALFPLSYTLSRWCLFDVNVSKVVLRRKHDDVQDTQITNTVVDLGNDRIFHQSSFRAFCIQSKDTVTRQKITGFAVRMFSGLVGRIRAKYQDAYDVKKGFLLDVDPACRLYIPVQASAR